MYEVDMFHSRFFIIEDAVKHAEIMKVLNTIKKDTENLATVSSEPYGPTYKTNYTQKEVHGKLFNTTLKQLNNCLAKDNVSFELCGYPWYAEYGEYDYHEPHIHSSHCSINDSPPYNTFKYSGIICLSDFGKTTFINPNSSSFYGPTTVITSKYNRVILFPSNLYHYVIPHGLRDKVRIVFSFNCILKWLV